MTDDLPEHLAALAAEVDQVLAALRRETEPALPHVPPAIPWPSVCMIVLQAAPARQSAEPRKPPPGCMKRRKRMTHLTRPDF
jgi:hypothetical protein